MCDDLALTSPPPQAAFWFVNSHLVFLALPTNLFIIFVFIFLLSQNGRLSSFEVKRVTDIMYGLNSLLSQLISMKSWIFCEPHQASPIIMTKIWSIIKIIWLFIWHIQFISSKHFTKRFPFLPSQYKQTDTLLITSSLLTLPCSHILIAAPPRAAQPKYL